MSSGGQNCPFGNHWPRVCMTALPPAASSELYHLSLFSCNLGINSQESAVFAEGWTAQISSPKFLTCCVSGWCSGGGTDDLTPWQFHWACHLCRCSSPWAATPLMQELQTNSREAAFLIMRPRLMMYKMTLRWPESHCIFQSTCPSPRGKADSHNQIYSRPFTSKLFGGTSLAVQWLRLCLPMHGVRVSIPGQGAKIPHASPPRNQNIKQKQYCNKCNKDLKEKKTQRKTLPKRKIAGQYLW